MRSECGAAAGLYLAVYRPFVFMDLTVSYGTVCAIANTIFDNGKER